MLTINPADFDARGFQLVEGVTSPFTDEIMGKAGEVLTAETLLEMIHEQIDTIFVKRKTMAFITRHEPTEKQITLAEEQGYALTHVGDANAFTIDPSHYALYDAVAVVHPAAALRLTSYMSVGVFENENRAPEGARPQFEARALHIYLS